MSIRRRVVTAATIGLGALASPLAAQQTYPQTLYWGAGLVDIPVAWVAPLSGDFALNYSVKTFEKGDQTVTLIARWRAERPVPNQVLDPRDLMP